MPIFLFLLSVSILEGQSTQEYNAGTISYITSQNIYVKFKSTKGISEGDTLYFYQADKPVPVLKVNNLSSISCVCTPISNIELTISDRIIAMKQILEKQEPIPEEKPVEAVLIPMDESADTLKKDEALVPEPKQSIDGRLSVSSYTNLSNTVAGNYQRFRYTFSLSAEHIANSNFSAETYISYVQRLNKPEEMKGNFFDGLKIYNLAMKYDFSESMNIWVGRKINPKLSNMGAIDGIQFEKRFKAFSVGVLAGSRPDYEDYGINFQLFQFGAYLGHDYQGKKGSMQNTLAFVEQTNSGKTDRRFAYFQHSNMLVKNLYFFGSFEFDLYKLVNETPENTFKLSNLYLLLRYRIIKELSVSFSYSARQNVIYYETYKDFLERLLERETLQGFRLQINYRPVKNLSIGLTGGYRYEKSDPKPTNNLYGYVSYNRIPGLDVSATVSVTVLKTAYLSANIYSIGLARELIPGKVQAGISYQYVDYNFYNNEMTVAQNMPEVNVTWRVYKKLSLSVYYEGTFEKVNSFNRFYVNLTQRF